MQAQAQQQIRAAEAHATEQNLNQLGVPAYATKLRFDYTLDPKLSREPFLVSAIYHDDSFTF